MTFCTMVLGLCASLYGQTPAIQGFPTAYDGDTLYFTNRAVRLYGIDALRLLLRNSQGIRCFPIGDLSHARVVAHCYTSDSRSLNATMVMMGKALDCARYSRGEFARLEPDGVRFKLKQKPYCNTRVTHHGR